MDLPVKDYSLGAMAPLVQGRHRMPFPRLGIERFNLGMRFGLGVTFTAENKHIVADGQRSAAGPLRGQIAGGGERGPRPGRKIIYIHFRDRQLKRLPSSLGASSSSRGIQFATDHNRLKMIPVPGSIGQSCPFPRLRIKCIQPAYVSTGMAVLNTAHYIYFPLIGHRSCSSPPPILRYFGSFGPAVGLRIIDINMANRIFIGITTIKRAEDIYFSVVGNR